MQVGLKMQKKCKRFIWLFYLSLACFSILSSSGNNDGSLFTNEEQKKIGTRCNVHFCHICRPCSRHQTVHQTKNGSTRKKKNSKDKFIILINNGSMLASGNNSHISGINCSSILMFYICASLRQTLALKIHCHRNKRLSTEHGRTSCVTLQADKCCLQARPLWIDVKYLIVSYKKVRFHDKTFNFLLRFHMQTLAALNFDKKF